MKTMYVWKKEYTKLTFKKLLKKVGKPTTNITSNQNVTTVRTMNAISH